MLRIIAASAAIVGTSGVALAQAPANPLQGQLSAPYGAGPATNNNNNAWGIANTPSGSGAAGALSTLYPPNTLAVPAPGTVVIRLNGRVEVVVSDNQTTANKGLRTVFVTVLRSRSGRISARLQRVLQTVVPSAATPVPAPTARRRRFSFDERFPIWHRTRPGWFVSAKAMV
jgi:glucose/arabinose dehydrogenase